MGACPALAGRRPGAPPGASGRQVRLAQARRVQLEIRACKRESRLARLEARQERLDAALARARERVLLLCLDLAQGEGGRSGPDATGTVRRTLLGASLVALLAGDRLAVGEGAAVGGYLASVDLLPPVVGPTGSPGAAPVQAPGAAAPVSEPLHLALTRILMDQLASDEIATGSAMVQRALQAQRTLLQNSLGAATRAPAATPATPVAQLLQGAFTQALGDTRLDLMDAILPPEFGPRPSRRAAAPVSSGGASASPAVAQAQARLDAAKRDVVAAIRKTRDTGSDIVIAAASLLAYGGFAAVAYGLDIGASISSIFTSSPVSGAAVATGTLSAVGNQFFLMAYASDAVAGAVAIHKFKEPYIDALVELADAEDRWSEAYLAYADAALPPGGLGPADGSTAVPPGGGTGGEPGGEPEPSASSAGSPEVLPGHPALGEADTRPDASEPARRGAGSPDPTSGAARRARPFGWW